MKLHLKTTVATLLASGTPQREIERRTGVDRKTIRGLLRAMGSAAGVEANSPIPATGPAGPVGQIPPPWPTAQAAAATPGTSQPKLPAHARSACETHREWIEVQVRLGRNAVAIYQDLVDEFGLTSR
ncbi:MAG: hypothetical protein IT518_26685 [Burkholderiales bacterium]|nr:hypothetical protein [Burkholderiales bacterium]